MACIVTVFVPVKGVVLQLQGSGGASSTGGPCPTGGPSDGPTTKDETCVLPVAVIETATLLPMLVEVQVVRTVDTTRVARDGTAAGWGNGAVIVVLANAAGAATKPASNRMAAASSRFMVSTLPVGGGERGRRQISRTVSLKRSSGWPPRPLLEE